MRTPPVFLIFCLTFTPVAVAQRIWFGVVTGTGLTSDLQGRDESAPADIFGDPASRFQFLSGPRSLILGALVEGRIDENWSVEANVLRRPMQSTLINTFFPAGGGINVSKQNETAVDAWEFPLLLKYTLPGRFRPFLTAGPSLRTQENAASTEPSRFGISAGVGAAIHAGRLRFAPQLRYTRWQSESIFPRYPTKPDQLEFLTSIAYETNGESRRIAGRRIELGVVAGLPLTSGFTSFDFATAPPERTRYLVGLSTEAALRGNLSIGVAAIYKPLRAGFPGGEAPFSVITWQFPALAKYRWTRPRWTPFAEGGPSFRLAGNLNGYNPSHYGVTVGGGVERRVCGIRLSPAVRYTHWAVDPPPYRLPPGVHYSFPTTNRNAIDLLFGVSF